MISWKINLLSEAGLYWGSGDAMVMAVALALLPGKIEAKQASKTWNRPAFYIPYDEDRDDWFCRVFATPWAECLEHVWHNKSKALDACLRSIRPDGAPMVILGAAYVGPLGGIAHRYADQLRNGAHPGALTP